MYKKFLLIGSGSFIAEIKGVLSNLALEVGIANVYSEITPRLKKAEVVVFDQDSYSLSPRLTKNILNILARSGKDFVVLSAEKSTLDVLAAKETGAADYILKPYNIREVNLRLSAILNKKKRISCIG
ncbi:MAG: hypothetical protein WCY42_05585, partial [Candidatus Omnitrophota bacterium]